MTEEQREEIKLLIEERISETRSEIESLKELTKPVAPDKAIGRLSRMDAINNKTINEAALRENLKKLQKNWSGRWRTSGMSSLGNAANAARRSFSAGCNLCRGLHGA